MLGPPRVIVASPPALTARKRPGPKSNGVPFVSQTVTPVECPRILYTDLDKSWVIATCGDEGASALWHAAGLALGALSPP